MSKVILHKSDDDKIENEELIFKTEYEQADSNDDDDSLEIPTVTIVEEDGTTSVVNDASVSSVITDNGPFQFPPISLGGHPSNNGVSFKLEPSSTLSSTNSFQVISPGLINGQQCLVIGADVNTGGRNIRPRPPTMESPNRVRNIRCSYKDERKRATHNEVERRRRDKINGWITKLSKIVPDNVAVESQQLSCPNQTSSSKGIVLAKAYEYIQQLKSTNCRLAQAFKDQEAAIHEVSTLREELAEARKEIARLKQELDPPVQGATIIISE